MSDAPLYTTEPTVTSLGSTYHIFAGRVELHTSLYGRLKVPFDHIVQFCVRPPNPFRDRQRDDHRLNLKLRCLRPDMAAFVTHVALERATGPYRLYRFAPPDPAGFVAALEAALRDRRG